MKRILMAGLAGLTLLGACGSENDQPAAPTGNPSAGNSSSGGQSSDAASSPEAARVESSADAELTQGDVLAATTPADWVRPAPENTIYMEVPQGLIVIAMTPDLAPVHVEQVRTLLREGYYDGLHFYRVIEGFVAQGGDQAGAKDKGTAREIMPHEFEEPIPDGLSFTPLGNEDGYAPEVGYINGFPAGIDRERGSVWLAHCAGAFAFGREEGMDTASTEFYITLQPQRYLDRNLTVFGRVIWGMDVVQSITRGRPGNSDIIQDRDDWTPILRARLASDVPDAERLPLEMLDTNSQAFGDLIAARRNRSEDFFYVQHDYIGLCQMPLPVRLAGGEGMSPIDDETMPEMQE